MYGGPYITTMSLDPSVQKPDNINYKAVDIHNGRYRLRKVPINNMANSSISLQAGATTLVEFKLPANTVWNTSRSSFEYMLNLPAQGAGLVSWNFEDTFEICGAIQFCNASGLYLTDLQYANNYVSVARKIDIDQNDFEANDMTSGLYKANGPYIAAGTARANYFPPQTIMPATNAFGFAAATNTTALSLIEPQYVRAGVVNTAMVVARSIQLNALTGTALGMDRDYIFSEDMYIRMQIAPSSKVGYNTPSSSDPITTPTLFAVQPTITNMYLQLAVQVDPVVESSVREKFTTGKLQYLIPYVYGWRNQTSAGIASIQISLNNQYGAKLKRLIHAPFAATESGTTAYDHQNLNGAKITAYQTFLDSQPLQDMQLSCLQPVAGGVQGMDDWRENKQIVRGSAIETAACWYENWAHVDAFSQPKRGRTMTPQENMLEGLDLSMPRQWTITANTVGALGLIHYTFGTFIRHVVATPQGTQVLVQ